LGGRICWKREKTRRTRWHGIGRRPSRRRRPGCERGAGERGTGSVMPTRRSKAGRGGRGASPPRPSSKIADVALAITSACTAAAVGFELCALRTHDETIAVAATNAAAFLRSLASETGVDARPRARTCDRLRWEWLASTGTVLDGAPDRRLASECARLLAAVDVSEAGALANGILPRFRVAAAEAHSLAAAIAQLRSPRTHELAFAYG
jgi:hypothetical protein